MVQQPVEEVQIHADQPEAGSAASILTEAVTGEDVSGTERSQLVKGGVDSNSGKFMLFIYVSRNTRKVEPTSLKSRIITAQALAPGA